MRRGWVLILVGICGLSLSSWAADAELHYVEGIASLTGSCFVRGMLMSPEVPSDIDFPEPQGDGLYAAVPLAVSEHAVMIDVSDEAIGLHVDASNDGIPVSVEWDRALVDGTLLASVSLSVEHEDGQTAPYQVFVMWNAYRPTVLTFCRDTYQRGTITLGSDEFALAVIDEDTDGRYDLLDGGVLLIDSDGDGELLATSDSHERFALSEPFNLGGVSYRVDAVDPMGTWIRILETEEAVPPKMALLPGFPAPGISGELFDGSGFSLPDLRGKIVILDFWAAWCGPCISELPTIKRLVEMEELGVVVLGINLDRTREELAAAVEEYELGYRQLYDGAEGPIGLLYRIEGIPMTYLIGADGRIVERGLRGQALVAAVEELLKEPADASAAGGEESE